MGRILLLSPVDQRLGLSCNMQALWPRRIPPTDPSLRSKTKGSGRLAGVTIQQSSLIALGMGEVSFQIVAQQFPLQLPYCLVQEMEK